jgi:hypothetical protein
MPPTFGRVEQWLQGPEMTPVIRRRLLVALTNIGADNPAAIAPAAPDAINNAIAEDGGEPV